MSAVMFDVTLQKKSHPGTNDQRQSRTSRYAPCSCCPYGYHIDLDFVRYCEALEQDRQQLTGTSGTSKRRERRRQRQSMEALLGLQSCQNAANDVSYNKSFCDYLHNQIQEEQDDVSNLRRPLTRRSSSTGDTASRMVEDALQDVVSDFERMLATQAEPDHCSKSLCNNYSYNLVRATSNSSVSSLSSGSVTGELDSTLHKTRSSHAYNAVLTESGMPIGQDCVDNISSDGSANSTLSTNALQNIREQMALSLERMRDLEEQVKSVNELKVQLSALKEENVKLISRLSKYENNSYFDRKWSNTLPFQKFPTSPLSNLGKLSTKDASIMCTVITRDIGVGYNKPHPSRTLNSPNTEFGLNPKYTNDINIKSCETNQSHAKSITTETILKTDERNETEKSNTSFNGKDNTNYLSDTIIIHNSKNTICDCSTQPHVQISDIIPVKQKPTAQISVGLQTLDQKWTKVSVGTQVISSEMVPKITMRDVAIQLLEPDKMNVGINTKPKVRNVSVDINPEIINNLYPCKKCRIIKRTIGVSTNVTSTNNEMVSLSTLMGPRSKSFNMGTETLDLSKRTRTTGVQYSAISVLNKYVQACPQTNNKFIQHEIMPHFLVNKGIQIEKCSNDEKFTDTKDLIPVKTISDKSCNTVIKYYKDAGVDVYVQCLECKKRMDEAQKVTKKVIVSTCENCKSSEKSVVKTEFNEFSAQKQWNDLEIYDDKKGSSTGTESCAGSQILSRIPRPTTLTVSAPEPRKFKRQQTYTKISAVECPQNNTPRLSALEHVTATICNSSIESGTTHSTIETVVSNVVPGISDNIASLSDIHEYRNHKCQQDQQKGSGNTSTDASESTLFLPVSDKQRQKVQPSKEMRAAMKVVNDALQKSSSNNLGSQLKSANNIIQQEWFKMSSTASANPLNVEDYLDAFEEVSSVLLQYVVNMADNSGNTAMHYAVSHGNFDVVSILLDSKVCNINRPNLAGYTSVMLVSLAEVRSPTHGNVVRKLFQLADVNIRAKQHGQTALMLAVSHGRQDMAALLLEAGADINIQDEDGSTALMCAAEHGHADIIRLFLSQHDCDSTITDVDGSTALKIALEAGHRDIGVLLYAHERMSRGASPYASLRRSRSGLSKASSPAPPSSPSHV